jgi:hypothetical protein
MTMTRMVVMCVLACACGQHLNPEYCVLHPTDSDCNPIDAMPDGGPCTSNADCHDPLPICDTARHECVMCTTAQNVCHNPTPVCDQNDMCQPMQCSSNVVLPDGTCANENDVIYVQPGGDTGTNCRQTTPCSLSEGLTVLSPRYIIHLADGTYPGPFSFNSTAVTAVFFGIRATLSGGTPVVSIPGGSKVDLDYVTIANGTNGGVSCAANATLGIHGASIRNNTGDVGIASACTLTMDAASVFANTSGGLQVTAGTFQIQNSAFFNNGDGNLRTSPQLLNGGTGVFAFNSVTHNTAKGGGGPPTTGVECNIGIKAQGNIVAGNSTSAQTAGNCDFTGSRTNGTGAEVMWLVFPPATAADLHLTAASPARNVPGLDCSGDPTDIDGEPRPMGGLCDQGADEYKE